jgi:hypothetical protein
MKQGDHTLQRTIGGGDNFPENAPTPHTISTRCQRLPRHLGHHKSPSRTTSNTTAPTSPAAEVLSARLLIPFTITFLPLSRLTPTNKRRCKRNKQDGHVIIQHQSSLRYPMRLTRTLIAVALATSLQSSFALANCSDDILHIIQKARTSGPFHFVSQTSGQNFVSQASGTLDPGRAKTETTPAQNGQQQSETINIGNKSWSKDDLGWRETYGPRWTDLELLADHVIVPNIPNESCKIADLPDDLKEFNYELKSITGSIEPKKIVIDKKTGLLSRFEQTGNVNVIITYRFDPTIRIAPPKVDIAERIAKSVARFEEAVAATDPACRQETEKILQNGLRASFHYKLAGSFASGIWGLNGEFVPPRSLRQIVEGVPGHGGGSEAIMIDEKEWIKYPGSNQWNSIKKSRSQTSMGDNLMGFLALPGHDNSGKSLVGAIMCPAGFPHQIKLNEFVEIDIYIDTTTERWLSSKRLMFVDEVTRRPVKFETVDSKGQTTTVETRIYDPNLRIEPPANTTPE